VGLIQRGLWKAAKERELKSKWKAWFKWVTTIVQKAQTQGQLPRVCWWALVAVVLVGGVPGGRGGWFGNPDLKNNNKQYINCGPMSVWNSSET
jgi:hypothetical protein